MTITEAARNASAPAVIRALFWRMGPDAQQALVDSLQAEINASRTAQAKASAGLDRIAHAAKAVA